MSHATIITKNDPDHHDVFPGGRAGVEVRNSKTALTVAFLNAHKVASGYRPTVVSVSADGSTVIVRCVEHHAATGWRDVEETIPATMQAARDWLGY